MFCFFRTPRSRKQQSTSSSVSLSLSQIATPRQTLSFSAASTPIDSRTTHESVRTSDASQLASTQEQSHLRQRRVTTTTTTTTVDGQWGERQKDTELSSLSCSAKPWFAMKVLSWKITLIKVVVWPSSHRAALQPQFIKRQWRCQHFHVPCLAP